MQQQRAAALVSIGLFLLTTLIILPLTTVTAWTKRNDAHGKTIIAYYASWQWYDRNGLAKPANLDHTKVTRYNFAFFQINESGDIWGTDEWADAITLYGEFNWMYIAGQDQAYCSWDKEGQPPTCAGHYHETGLIYQAHQAGTEVYPSIGGWTLSDPFPALAANPAARKKFAENCVKLIETYDFDGIDIDWEYPGYAAHSGTPADTENYSLFLRDIREALDELGSRTGRFYGLTAALPCGPALISNIQIDVVKDYLTELNLMTYDFHGSWNPETGPNAPLYDWGPSPEFSVHGCVENWKKGGGRPDQINIGLPFYGRSFSGSSLTSFGDTHSGYADSVTWADDEGSPQYFNIVDKLSQFTSIRDPVTKTQYMYNSQGFVSYDDELAICDKTEYAVDHGLNGYIIWEISGDLLLDKSTPLLDATNDRLNTDERCNPDEPIGDAPEMGGSTATIEGNPWYPSQSLGYCLDDGKELELYIKPSQIFGSAIACCEAMFSHKADCVSSSLDPGSDGQWVDLAEDPWYPHIDLGYCVKDGNEAQYFTPDEYKFSSAEACCDGAYSFEPNCVSWSLNPGSTGRWVEGVDQGDPWYPQAKVGYCVSDGKHEKNNIGSAHLFNSAEACCDTIYSYSADCLSDTMSSVLAGDSMFIWYPDGSGCSSETPIPSWISTTYSSKNECCLKYFGEFHDTCMSGVEAQASETVITNEPTPYPTPHPTKKSKPNPNNMDAYVVQDVEASEPEPDPTVSTVLNQATTAETPIPLPAVPTINEVDQEEALNAHLFYPFFGDGTSAACRTGGDLPEWITQGVLKDTHQECCGSFSSPWLDQCLNHPYYPNFQKHTCTNDGQQPDWMAGDYLSDDQWRCCHNFFSESDKLGECT